MIELKLKLENVEEIMDLMVFLEDKRKEFKRDNRERQNMIKLLKEDSKRNSFLDYRINHEKTCIEMNQEKINFVHRVNKQLEPFVKEYFNI